MTTDGLFDKVIKERPGGETEWCQDDLSDFNWFFFSECWTHANRL